MRLATIARLVLCIPAAAASAQTAAPAPPPGTVARRQSIVALRIEPREVALFGPRAEARVLVTGIRRDGSAVDLTASARLESTNVRVVRSAGSILRPAGNGAAVVTVRAAGQVTDVPVAVRGMDRPAPVDFAREVVPILNRAGCAAGACHGASAGKGGFRLSLFGSDPAFDYLNIVRHARGRRVQLADPENSLLLRKPTLRTAHQGGRRLQAGSADYRILLRWLLDGAPGPRSQEPALRELELFPAHRVLQPGGRQPLVVRAVFSDGVTMDVTRWARLSSLNDGIAAVSPEGIVRAAGRGETSVLARFFGRPAAARITVPFAAGREFPEFSRGNFVDRLVAKKWKELGLEPSPPCDDATFLRRACLDILGTLPTPAEVEGFLTESAPDKRERLIDRLLARPEYADYWALKWADLLRSNRVQLGPKGMWSYTNWIRAQFRENTPADRFARALITAQGSSFTSGPANYYRVAGSPPDLAETTAQVFLGTRLQCAKCHNHPFEKWSQAEYYQFAAFFARLDRKGSQEFGLFGNEQVVRVNAGGEVHHPKTGARMVPTPLGGYPVSMRVRGAKGDLVDPDPDASGDRRALLADWISQGNPLFARNIANRYWGYLMGRGLVEPVDDQRATNPPTNPELLDALAADFARNGYDIKRLIRTICTSRAYGLSADVTPRNRADRQFYTHYFVKRIPAEPLLDAICAATGTVEKFPELPAGFRAIQLPDPQVASTFLDTFGRAPRTSSCECERPAEPNMGQALHLMMGDLIQRKVADPNGRVAKLIAEKKSDPEILEQLYLATLSRPPRADEKARALSQVRATVERPALLPRSPRRLLPVQIAFGRSQEARDRDRRAVLEDILWALLNSKEFALNH